MKIVLISSVFFDLGISTLAPLLKKDGHNVKQLFIPHLLHEGGSEFSEKTITTVVKFVQNADLIGINGFSENHFRIAMLADGIKKTVKTPLVWGGIHATLRPEECIKHADIVCVGEGEKALLELTRRMANGEQSRGVKNLLFRTSPDDIKKLELYPLIDLNELLPLDYDLNTQYVMEDNRIRGVIESDFKGTLIAYSGRGCPFRCSYCCNHVIHDMYKGERVYRQRDIDKVISDLKGIKERFPSFKHLWFNDADFLSGKTQKNLERFSELYKKEIGIPFYLWSNPTAVTDERVKALKNAGLVGLNIGTVSGSEKIQRLIYKRNASCSLYIEKSAILKKYDVPTEYDFILCNPYEKEDDIVNTIKLFMRFPKPFRIAIFSLAYFPKTELYEMAISDGKIEDKQVVGSYNKTTYKVWKFDDANAYLNIVASLMRGRARRVEVLKMNWYGMLPEPVLRFLINKNVIRVSKYIPFNRSIYHAVGNLIMIVYIATIKLSSLKKKLILSS